MGLCEGENMSRSKSGALIKRALRGTSDAGRAGWRPRVDMAESARINGLRPAAVVEAPPVEPVPAAIVAPIEAETREFAAPPKPEAPPRRMAQVDLFAALGVKV